MVALTEQNVSGTKLAAEDLDMAMGASSQLCHGHDHYLIIWALLL
jgi:hypothetical protein